MDDIKEQLVGGAVSSGIEVYGCDLPHAIRRAAQLNFQRGEGIELLPLHIFPGDNAGGLGFYGVGPRETIDKFVREVGGGGDNPLRAALRETLEQYVRLSKSLLS